MPIKRKQPLLQYQMSNIPDKILDGLLISNLAARSSEGVLRAANIGTIIDLATLQVRNKQQTFLFARA